MICFNKEFGYATVRANGRSEKIPSAFEPCSSKQINNVLVCLFERVINSGSTIKYKNKYYALYDNRSKQIALNKGTKVTIVKTLSGEFYASRRKGINYKLIEVPERNLFSPAVDVVEIKKPKTKYKPSSEHPWSYTSQMYFKEHNAMMRKLYAV